MNTIGTILLVDDSENDTFLFRVASQKAGLRNPLQEVHDGEQAVAYLSGAPPFNDRAQYPLPILMLLDLKMPKKTASNSSPGCAPKANFAACLCSS